MASKIDIPQYNFSRKSWLLELLKGISLIVFTAVVLLLFGILYFTATVWLVKIGAGWAGYRILDPNNLVLTAGIITAGVIIGSSMQRR